MIKDLDGKPVQMIVEGQEYLVPTVHGIPVVLPSHVDEGNDGKTSRHWHTDDRWGSLQRGLDVWSSETIARLHAVKGDFIKSDTIRDDGQEVVYQTLKAEKTVIWPSGGAFSSLIWLYYHFGDISAKDGHCAHHHTHLQSDGAGGLICPAHGLRYKEDGSPRFQGPFFLRGLYRPLKELVSDNDPKFVDAPIHFDGPIKLPFPQEAMGSYVHEIQIVDIYGQSVGKGYKTLLTSTADAQIEVTITAWPSDGYCPSLNSTEPACV